jgi:PST family polysaccharide transporter
VDYFSGDNLRTDLKGKTVRGGFYLAVGQAVLAATSLVSIPILTRLLTPADFGLVAMVTVFTGIASMFVDAGLTMATIQRDRINHQQVTNLFWVAAAFGLLIALVVAASSPLIAWFYGEPRIVLITLALSAAPFFSGLTIQHLALLRRAMRLRALTCIQIAAAIGAYGTTILLAWWFHSYWALVMLPISMAVIRMIGSWLACEWRPGLPRPGVGVRSMIGFGANITGFNFLNYFARCGDNMLIGRVWGEGPLGLYERSYKLMIAPLNQINAPLGQLMIPALSRLINQPAKYRSAYFRAGSVFQVVSCPLMAFVAVMAPQVVRIVLGPGFENAGPILRWLAIAGFIQPLTNSTGWLYASQGRGRDALRWGIVGASLTVLSFLLGLPWGPLGVARAYAVMFCVVTAPLAIYFTGAKGPVSRADLYKLSGEAVVLSAPTAVASLLVSYFLRPESAIVGVLLAGVAAALATLPLLIFTRLGRTLIAQFKDIARQVLARPQRAQVISQSSSGSSGNTVGF